MSEQSLNRNTMLPSRLLGKCSRGISRCLLGFLLGLALAGATPLVHALSTDKDKPIEVEADTAELDDVNNVSVYTGNVVLTQGSIRMTGDKMTVYNTENNELDTLIMEGRPATYRQLPDDSDVYDEAQALTIKYFDLKDLVILLGKAEVKQEGFFMKGDRIDYDTQLSQVKAQAAARKGEGPGAEKQDRVKVILKKKKETEETPAPDAKQEPPATPAPDGQ
jgi:lipopolysaccharide export system protein LptA